MNRRRCIFLFNHDAAHQTAHSAGIMAVLARQYPFIEVVAAVGSAAIENHVRSLVRDTDANLVTFVDLSLPRRTDRLLSPPNAIFPAKRLARLRRAEGLISSADLLVSTERTCLVVKKRLKEKGAPCPDFVFVPHGAGDRGVTYHPSLADFDYHLVGGQKVKDEMIAHGVARPDNCHVIGYPKFDVSMREPVRLFENDRPTILYNPHFEPRLSSWYDFGPDLLSALARQDRFNVIFAPHVMLWRKRWHISPEFKVMRRRPDIPSRLPDCEHVLIDTGSPALFDMTYTASADIYIGDVSSQVYEFLRTPKPCIFIDAAGDGPQTYPFWANGPVAGSVAEVLAALDHVDELTERYRGGQERLFAYTIDIDPQRTASQRGAETIAKLLS